MCCHDSLFQYERLYLATSIGTVIQIGGLLEFFISNGAGKSIKGQENAYSSLSTNNGGYAMRNAAQISVDIRGHSQRHSQMA